MERFAPWLSERSRALFDEAHQLQMQERALRVMEEHHRIASISLHIEKLLKQEALTYALQTKTMVPGAYFEGIPKLKELLDQLPTEALRDRFATSINRYGERLQHVIWPMRTTWKNELESIPASDRPARLGQLLYRAILGRNPVGRPRAEVKDGYFQIICEDDADYAALYRRHGKEELPGEKGSAGCHITEVVLNTKGAPSDTDPRAPLIVLHEKRSGHTLEALKRHEFQHFIQHAALQLFELTEPKLTAPSPATDRTQEVYLKSLRPIKDEVLAYTREGRSANATQEAIEGDLYKKLFEAVPQSKRAAATAHTKAAIKAINQCLLLEKHGEPGRDLLVNLLYRIPLDRIPTWIPVINSYYEKRVAIASAYGLINKTKAYVRTPPISRTLTLTAEKLAAIPEAYRTRYKNYEKIRVQLVHTRQRLEQQCAPFPEYFPIFDVLSVDTEEVSSTPAPPLTGAQQNDLKNTLKELYAQEAELTETERLFAALPKQRVRLFAEELTRAKSYLLPPERLRLVSSVVQKQFRPQLERYTSLAQRLKEKEKVLFRIEQELTQSYSFQRALEQGDALNGHVPQIELDQLLKEIRTTREAADTLWQELHREGTMIPFLKITQEPSTDTKKGPHPFELVHDALLALGTSYQRHQEERLRTIRRQTTRHYDGSLDIVKGTEAAKLQQDIL